MLNKIKIQLFALLLIVAPALMAESMLADKIQIRADFMRYDMNTGTSQYQGNVSMSQGTMELTGDQVLIERKNSEMSLITITGQPARYQQNDVTNKVLASSRQIKYSVESNQLELLNDARLEQADRTVESERIVYDTENKVVIAGNSTSQDDQLNKNRVNITLTPKSDETKTSLPAER